MQSFDSHAAQSSSPDPESHRETSANQYANWV
ncbi:hypothetical protein ACLB1Q_12240 [Escherichia coli]